MFLIKRRKVEDEIENVKQLDFNKVKKGYDGGIMGVFKVGNFFIKLGVRRELEKGILSWILRNEQNFNKCSQCWRNSILIKGDIKKLWECYWMKWYIGFRIY